MCRDRMFNHQHHQGSAMRKPQRNHQPKQAQQQTRCQQKKPILASMLIAGLLTTVALAGCSSFRVRAPERPGATDHSKVVWSYAWGLVPGLPEVECQGQALAEVTVDSHVGYDLISVITLGLASPKKISWTCARAVPDVGVIDLGAAGPASPPPPSPPGQSSADASSEAGGGA